MPSRMHRAARATGINRSRCARSVPAQQSPVVPGHRAERRRGTPGDPLARSTATATRPRTRSKGPLDNTGLIPVLARAVREVETAAGRGPVGPAGRTKFQVIALLVREERARAKTDPEMTESERAETLKRLDGVATILAKTAARDTSLITLLEKDHP